MQRHFALLNDENICFAILSSVKEPEQGNFVEVETNDLSVYEYRKYENGQWSAEKYLPPEPPIQTTIEEQIYAENLYQTALLELQMMGGV